MSHPLDAVFAEIDAKQCAKPNLDDVFDEIDREYARASRSSRGARSPKGAKYAAIPTMYAGVQFRSRLEARYAAYFDLLEWDWQYEPFDLNGYIPDFYVVRGPLDTEDLFEIKPATAIDDPEIAAAQAKIDNSGWFLGTPDDFRCATVAGIHPRIRSFKLNGGLGHWGHHNTGHPEPGSDHDRMWREAGNRVQWRSPRAGS